MSINKHRRLVIALGAGALVATAGSFAQQRERIRRIGVLILLDANDPARQSLVAALSWLRTLYTSKRARWSFLRSTTQPAGIVAFRRAQQQAGTDRGAHVF